MKCRCFFYLLLFSSFHPSTSFWLSCWTSHEPVYITSHTTLYFVFLLYNVYLERVFFLFILVSWSYPRTCAILDSPRLRLLLFVFSCSSCSQKCFDFSSYPCMIPVLKFRILIDVSPPYKPPLVELSVKKISLLCPPRHPSRNSR